MITLTTANVVTNAERLEALGVAIAAHSNDRSAPATAMSIRNGARHSGAGQLKTQTAHSAMAARTRPETTLTPKLVQSNALARDKDVIDSDPAVASLTRVEIGNSRLQMLRSIVRPVDILEDQFGVGAFPKQEV